MQTTKNKIIDLLGLALATAIVRVLPFNFVFMDGKTYFYDPDCYIRFKNVLVYLEALPRTSIYNYYQGFPVGTGVISAPVLEQFVAILVFPLSVLTDIETFLPYLTAFLPIVFGCAAVALTYLFLDKHFGRLPSVIASALLLLVPAFIDATVLGRFDNEMAEPLLLLLAYRQYVKTYEEGSTLKDFTVVGLLSALYLFVWRGAIFPLSILGMDMLFRAVFAARAGATRSFRANCVAMYGSTAALTAFVCLFDIWGTRTLFSFNVVSWFHVALFAGAGAFLCALNALVAGGGRLSPRTKLTLAAGCVFASLLLFFFLGDLIEGLKVVFGGNPWIDSIQQYQRGGDLLGALSMYGGAVFFSPLALFLLRSEVFGQMRWKRLLLLWTLIMLMAIFARQRFGIYYAINLAVLTAIAVRYVQAKCSTLQRAARNAVPLATVGLLLVLQAPAFPYAAQLYRNGAGSSPKGDIEEAMLWLKAHTPPPGNPYRPDIKPDYGVLARWEYGGWIETIAQRPAIATPFGTETYGMEAVAGFFLAEGEEEMESVLRENRARYVLLDKMIGDLSMYAALVGSRKEFFAARWDPVRREQVYLPTAATFSLVSSRLYFADGTLRKLGQVVFLPVEGLRLVYESSTAANVFGFPWEIKKIKIFEALPGASIECRGEPGAAVSFSQPIETNAGRRFTYSLEKRFGEDGRASFRVLYPAKTQAGSTAAVGPAVLVGSGVERSVIFSSEEIHQGKSVELAF